MKTYLARKVPHVTAIFWVVKVLTTAFGESLTDYSVRVINPVVAVSLGFVGLLIALWLQFRTQRYIEWVYWLAVVMVAVFGTMAADVTHLVLGVPYAASALVFTIVLSIIFVVWYRSERTLSIHQITTPKRELFYWLTVLVTFALGTAAGDYTAVTLHLGYLISGLLFAAVIVAPAVAYFGFGTSEVTTFWFAYIVTRPLGASFADWFGKPVSISGLGFGDGVVSAILITAIIILVGYLQWTGGDVERNGLHPSYPKKPNLR